MTNRENKPKMSSEELINKLKIEKGITFKYISEEQAIDYLMSSNNYMRTAAYRRNYQKRTEGPNRGKYINLDFSYLQELSVIDMHLRNIIAKMCIDIEHDIKVKLIADLENNKSSDGYNIVNEFIKENGRIIKDLEIKSNSPFIGELIKKYFTIKEGYDEKRKKKNKIEGVDCPVWVLLELLSFGDTIRFYELYYKKYYDKCEFTSILHLVRNLRNGVAHNSCILVDLNTGTTKFPPEISKFVSKISTINKGQRKKKLACRTILEFTSMLYLYDKIVSKKVKKHGLNQLKEFVNGRMIEKSSFFEKNELVLSTFDYINKLVNYF